MKLNFSLEKLMAALPSDLGTDTDLRTWKIEVREAASVENMGRGASLGKLAVRAPRTFPKDNDWRQGAVLSDNSLRVAAWLAKGFDQSVEVIVL